MWRGIVTGVRSRKPSLGSILEHGAIINLSEQEITIGLEGAFFKEQAELAENRQVIEGVIKKKLGLQRRLKFVQQPLAQKPEHPLSQAEGQRTPCFPKPKDPFVERVSSLFEGQVVEVKDISQPIAPALLSEGASELDSGMPLELESD
jgi:hypothetical protein